MRYPPFIQKNGTIGLVAPSFGAGVEPYATRLTSAIERFHTLGYQTKISSHAFSLEKCQSSPAVIRAAEFMAFYTDPEVDFLLSLAGGERMIEILPYLDFNLLKKSPPKFFQGYSDNTCLTFLLPTILDVASIYGVHAPDFGMDNLDLALEENLEIISGRLTTQDSYPFYEIDSLKGNPGQETSAYQKIHPTYYHNLRGEELIHMEGRLLGGCLDVLTSLCGTPFDQVAAFNKKYGHEGIIWFLEAAELTSAGVIRALWQLRQAGWFKEAKGFIFGRYGNVQPFFDLSHHEAILSVLQDLKVPIVADVDIGHLPPMFSVITGAKVIFQSTKGRGSIHYLYE